MSIGFVVGMLLICSVFGLKRMAMLFGIILWVGLTIFHPWLLLVWGGLFLLAKS